MSDVIDTVVRFHDIRRLPELKRCIFSLVGQTYRPLRVILVLQRFSAADIAATQAALAPLLVGPHVPDVVTVDFQDPEPADARSVLLNLGVQAATGRYLAFLDYDDVLYPEAYAMLIGRLRDTYAAIAFASVRVLRVNVYDHFFQAIGRGSRFPGTDLIDLFRKNFCPLHSYVMDRAQIAPEDLAFDATLTFEEDYDVLLRICAHLPSDFALIGTNVGDYYYKTDGSNTVPTDGKLTEKAALHYAYVRSAIERRRQTTMVTADIQRKLGLPAPEAPMSVRDVADRFPQRP